MTVSMYRHCEEERRSNPVKNNILNRITSIAIINSIINIASCATGTFVMRKIPRVDYGLQSDLRAKSTSLKKHKILCIYFQQKTVNLWANIILF